VQWKSKRINKKALLYRWARTQPVLTQWFLTNLSFQKLRKAAIRFVMSVCPPVSPYETTRLPLDDFHETWSWLFFENISRKFDFYWNLTRITSNLHDNQYTFFIISRSFLLGMRNVSDKVVEKITTRVWCSIIFISWKSCSFWDNVEECGRDGQAADGNMANVQCVLDA